MFWLGFAVGAAIGGFVGMMFMALFAANKELSDDDEFFEEDA